MVKFCAEMVVGTFPTEVGHYRLVMDRPNPTVMTSLSPLWLLRFDSHTDADLGPYIRSRHDGAILDTRTCLLKEVLEGTMILVFCTWTDRHYSNSILNQKKLPFYFSAPLIGLYYAMK